MIPEKQRYENLEKFTPDVVGRYDIPVIKADKVYFSGFIGFNYAATAKDRAEKAVHFFLDDYQFFRVWNRPRDYINTLSKFACVLSPDFRCTPIFLWLCRYIIITASTGWGRTGSH